MREIETVRLLVDMLDPVQRWRCAGLIVLAIAAAILEVFSAFGVLWLIGLLHDPTMVAKLPFIGGWAATFCCDYTRLLLWLCLGVAVFYILKNAFLLMQGYLQLAIPYQASVQGSSQLLDYYLRMPYAHHFHRNSSELVRNVMTTVDYVFRVVLVSLVGVISDTFLILTLVVILLYASSVQTLLAVGSLGVVVALMLRWSQQHMGVWGEEAQVRSEAVMAHLTQALNGVKEVQVRGKQAYFAQRYRGERDGLTRLYLYKETVAGVPRLLLEAALVLILTILIALAAVNEQHRGELVPLLALYGYAGFRLMPAVGRLAVNVLNVRFGAQSVADIHKDITAWRALRRDGGDPDKLPLGREIVFEKLSYTYPGAERPALDELSLRIGKGETIGIVGASGAGKSTIIDILTGLLEPTSGRLLVDGKDVREAIGSWRRSLGYVPQVPFLLDDSLRRNIAFGLPDSEIDEAAVEEAARLAQLEVVYRDQPEGLDLVVGERGVRLSGGQRQRIAIARALYGRPDVLIFDEATSALDNTTEQQVSQAIQRLGGERVVVIVAHRLATIRNCDRILFMKRGRIAGAGTYDELVATIPEFAAMASADAAADAVQSMGPT